jgi:2-desacetyl-2-hydroxyethyl bacteriochlorophyllide A dehydrogenase
VRVVQVTSPGLLANTYKATPVAGRDAMVRVLDVGICGTDASVLAGAIPISYPRVMGHEMVGLIESGSDGGTIPTGTRVMVNPSTWCGRCDLCERNLEHLCRGGGLLGRDEDGVFAEFVVAPEKRLHVIPDGISADAATLLQVVGTVVHAQGDIELVSGQDAVVIGLGVTGLLHLQLLVASGLSAIGITRSASKRSLASQFGASATGRPEDAAALIAEITDGRGADIVIDSAGAPGTLEQAIDVAGHHSHVVVFGTLMSASVRLAPYKLYRKELTLHHPRAALSRDYDEGIALAASGRLVLEPLVSARYALSRASSAFKDFNSAESLKVVMEVST